MTPDSRREGSRGEPHYLERELYERARADETILRFIEEGSLDGIWFWDVTRPEEEWMSPRFKALFGYADHEVPNKSSWWQKRIYPEDLDETLENFKAHLENPEHPYDQIVRYRHRDGSTVWVRCRGLAIRDEAGEPLRMLGAHTDVTELVEAREELEHRARALESAERRFRTLFHDAPIGMVVTELDGTIIRCNPSFARIVGRPLDDLAGIRFQDLTHPDDVAAGENLIKRLVAGEIDHYELEKRYVRPDGNVVWAQINGSVLREGGQPHCFITQVQDVTDRRRMQADLERLALEDELTGLLNRGAFEAELEAHDARAKRYGPRGSLIVFDIDNFKAVNDARGHQAGDEVLRAVGAYLRERLRASDTVGRLGGDEFVVLLHREGLEEAARVAEEIDSALGELLAQHDPGARRPLRVSVGFGAWSEETMTSDQVMTVADGALYEAKRRGIDAARKPRAASGPD